MASEPEIIMDDMSNSSRQSTEDLRERIDELSVLELHESPDFEDGEFSESLEKTGDLEEFDAEELNPPPPPPVSPPPAPTDSLPDFTDDTVISFDNDTEAALGHSPPLSAANLRSASRQRSRKQEPLIQEDNASPVERERGLLGAAAEGPDDLPFWRPPELSSVSSRTKHRMLPVLSGKTPKVSAPLVTEQECPREGAEERAPEESSKKVPPPTLPKPKRQNSIEWPPKQSSLPRVPPSASQFALPPESRVTEQVDRFANSDEARLPPRGSVLARAASINQGQLDALNEKIIFLEKQLKVSAKYLIIVEVS